MPKAKITTTITEQDRLAAGHYSEPGHCLLCAALRREGVPVFNVGPGCVYLQDGSVYEINEEDSKAITRGSLVRHPYYDVSLVGRTMVLTHLPEETA